MEQPPKTYWLKSLLTSRERNGIWVYVRRAGQVCIKYFLRHLTVRFLEDIMYEVFRAMKFLDFEWKLLNAYHVVVRRKPKNPDVETVRSFKIFLRNSKQFVLILA